MALSRTGMVSWLKSHLAGPLAVALAVMVLVVSEAGFWRLSDLAEAREESVHTQLAAGRLRRALLFMESAKRGYMLTGRQDYLAPFVEQEGVFQQTLAEVEAVALTDAEQRASLVQLVELARRKYSEMTEVLRLWDAGDRDAAIELTLTDLGREMMAQISTLTDTVIREESAFYEETARARARVFMWSRVGIWVLVALCIAGAVALMRLGREQERERRVHLLQLHAERDRLDEEVTRRTAETVELAQHMEQVREDERARLARELHDELGGLLTASKLDLARIRRRIQDDTGATQQLLAHLGESLDAGIALKRRIIEDLRPSSLSNLGLVRTLQIQCAEFGQRAELPVAVQLEEVPLTAERSLAVYRLVQEALTNIAKYAQARQVHVVMRRVDEGVELSVEDDGIGFDPVAVARAGGHGLQGMRFRIRSCGGDVQIRSAPGQGTTVRAVLPA